jgi:DNA-binding NarL/FixJ family response regulator
LHGLKKHNVSNENIVDFDVNGAVDFLYGSSTADVPVTRTLPSIIVIDVPDISLAVKFVSIVKSHSLTELIPTVIFTEDTSDIVFSELYGAGANSVIPKPADQEQLSEVILSTMMYWTLLNHNPV